MHVGEVFGVRKGAELLFGQPPVAVNVSIAEFRLILCREGIRKLGFWKEETDVLKIFKVHGSKQEFYVKMVSGWAEWVVGMGYT